MYKYTYIREQPLAATIFKTGIVYIINRSSLCGRKEYKEIKPSEGRINTQHLRSTVPSGRNTILQPRARGKAE